jgi:NTP pyrophosphatase (non-canonical NTP hydrolase)
MVNLMDEGSYSLEDLMVIVRKFVEERNWQAFQKPTSLALSAVIELGELLELFQWLTHDEIVGQLEKAEYRESLADELADVLIYLLRIADTTSINPTLAILDKMKKNAQKYPVTDWRGKIPDRVS